MTKMMDLIEEYLIFRQYKYLRLDGSSPIAERRDMVTSWQTNPDIFVFCLSTRAGGLGINLTAADTVIFCKCNIGQWLLKKILIANRRPRLEPFE